MPKSLNDLFRLVILANELDNSIALVLCFSDPDGVRSGKSGWSFGVCQFDTQNNDSALDCLRACGFTSDEIKGIVLQAVDVKPLAVKLAAHADIVENYDTAQLSKCLNDALNFDTQFGVPLADTTAILAQADYTNQYGSMGNGSKVYYLGLGRPITAEDILDFKLNHTVYGKAHPDDCRRRYNNLLRIVAANKGE
jgi:hypothetical protein